MKLLLAGGLSAFALGLFAQDPFSDTTIEATQVSGPVYMLTGAGGNIGLMLAEGGPLMIDDEFAPLEDKIRAAVKELAGTANPRYLVNTHWHGDHTGGNAGFGTTSTLIAQDQVRVRLKAGDDRRDPAPTVALPNLTYAEGMSLHLDGQTVELHHYPRAHTDGDSIVIFHEAKVVHMGDILFNHLFPFIDPGSGGSVKGYLAAQNEILKMLSEDWKIIPGHGELAGYQDLVASRDMILATSKIVAERKASGMSREDCLAAGLPSAWDSWSWQFISTETWLGTLYDSEE